MTRSSFSLQGLRALFLLLLCAVGTTTAWAVPAKHITIQHTQKDGTVLTLTLQGDEHLSYYTTPEGIAMRLGDDGDYYTVNDLSGMQVRASARRAVANQQRIQRIQSNMLANVRGPRRTIGQYNKMSGVKKGLVILVNFQDVTFKPNNNQAAFNNQFNASGYSANGHIGSVKDYFSAQSYGAFTVDFDVVGPVTVSKEMAHYGAPKGNDNDSYPASMVIEAIKNADTECGVDYSKYDWDNDGYVDQVFVVYAGYNEAQGGSANTIWPHEWTLASANYYGDGTGRQKIDGKWINTYACTSELCGTSGSTMDGIGTACHEFSHCLGYPDLYDTDGSTNGSAFGMSYYDLMAGGSYNGPNGMGEVPCGYSAYERWMAGWITPTELTEAASISGMVTIDNATDGGMVVSNNSILANSPSRAYLIKNGSDNDYYLLENRPNTGYFGYFRDRKPGSGLFITHVKYDKTAWEKNVVNTYSSNQRLTFVPADGEQSLSNYTTDFFPTNRVTSFSEVSSKQVSNIAKSGNLISFDFMGGVKDDGSRYTITLDAGTGSVSPSSWTQTYMAESFVLPEPQTTVPDWKGAGWSLTKITTDTSLDDLDDIIDYGNPYQPTEDVTLYALYMTQQGEDIICNSVPTATCYSISFNSGAGTCTTTSWSQTSTERKITLPSAVCSFAGWSFAGWSTEQISTTTEVPFLLEAGSEYQPTSDCTLYAVYCATENGDRQRISTLNVQEYASANSWVEATVYSGFTINGVTYSQEGGGDNGKYYPSNHSWRFYSGGTVKIKAPSNIVSVTSDPNKSFAISGCDASCRIGDKTSFTSIEVVYGAGISTYDSNPTSDASNGNSGNDDDRPDPTFGTYYSSHASSLDGKNGQSLELALSAVIYPHTKRSYDNLWTDFKTTDVVPNTTEQVYDMYSDNIYYYSTADHNTDFNREHSVPNSWWGGESGNATAYTDLHHLVPSDVKSNGKKSNYPLGCGHGLQNAQQSSVENSEAILWSFASTGADSYGGGSGYVWEPEDQYKGDFARMYLYVVCAYEGNITWQTDYMFVSDANNHTTIKPWAKELLLQWHRQDPVSTKERARNNAVYSIQYNRNPFIDYPELVEYIWGEKTAQPFSLSSAVSAYSQDYITAHPDVADTGNGGVCDNGVTPDEPKQAAIYFPHIAHLGKAFTAPKLKMPAGFTATLTYTSSNPSVATVDSESGAITLKAVGTTIITVTSAETDTYAAGSASYMIDVR